MNSDIIDIGQGQRARGKISVSLPGGCLALDVVGEPCPYNWMYADRSERAGMRFTVENVGGWIQFEAPVNWRRFTVEHFNGMLAEITTAIRHCKVPGCGRLAFVHPSCNRDGKCEACFMQEIEQAFREENARAAKREARADARMKAKGYRWKVSAWIHPKEGGDDYQASIYYQNKPTDIEIRRKLAASSAVTNDYRLAELGAEEARVA